MKAVFVLGFYDPVKIALDSLYADRISDGSINWVGQKSQGREANLTEFSAAYSKLVKAGMQCALILAAKPRDREWVIDAIRNIAQAASHDGMPNYQVIEMANLGDRDGVLQHIADFQLEPLSALSCEKIKVKTVRGKILCVSAAGSTSVLDALRRAGFPEGVISMFFEEERIEGSRNSNLMEHLAERSEHFGYLLYSFTGLRTLTPTVKGKFERCYEAPTAAKLAELARRWLEGN